MLNLKYQNLNFYNPIRSNIFSKSFVLSNEKYPELGCLFIVLNIGGSTHEGFKVADILQEIARLEYFKARGRKNDPVKNFENTVTKINQAFTTLAEANHVEWIDRLNFALISLYEDQIQLVHVGNIKTFLLRNNNLISLIKKEKDSSINPQKIFSSIVSGTLQENDKLIASTPELFDYFSQENVKNMISKLSPKDACFKFQENLSQRQDNTYSIASIFLEISPQSKIKNSKIEPELQNFPSLNDLETEKESIQNKPSPSTKIAGDKVIDEETGTQESKSDSEKNNVSALFNKIRSYSSQLPDTITSTGKNIIANFKGRKQEKDHDDPTLSKINKDSNAIHDWKGGYSSNFNRISSKTSNIFQGLIARYHDLPKTSKILFIVSIVFAFAFLASISMQATKKNSNKKDGVVEQKLTDAVEKEKMAGDALIYSDFDEAKELLFEAKDILQGNEISKSENEEVQKEKEDLLNKISANFDKIDKIIRIEDPILTVDISSDIQIESILGIDENAYTYNFANNTIYQVEESAKRLGTISSNSTNLGYIKRGAANSTKNSLLFLTDSPSIAEFDLEERVIEELNITFAKSDAEITDIKTYNDRLYALDTKNNQIYKHTRTISGYSKGISWINEGDYDINKAVSFAIDGAVYILENNGNVQKYLNGYKKDYKLFQPSNPAESPTKIFTLIDYKFLYILDPANNRLLVFDKQSGEIINQYISDKFTDMKNLYVDEINKKIFLLCGDKIYGFVLENFEEE